MSGNLRRGTSKPTGEVRAPFSEPTEDVVNETPEVNEFPEVDEEEIPLPDDDSMPLPVPLDDTSAMELRIIELESEVESLKERNKRLEEANENLGRTLAMVTPDKAKSAGPKYVARISAPKLVPEHFRDADGKPDLKAITNALNSDESLVIPGIERRG